MTEGRIELDGFILEITEVRERHLIGSCSGCGLVTPTTVNYDGGINKDFTIEGWFKRHLFFFRQLHVKK